MTNEKLDRARKILVDEKDPFFKTYWLYVEPALIVLTRFPADKRNTENVSNLKKIIKWLSEGFTMENVSTVLRCKQHMKMGVCLSDKYFHKMVDECSDSYIIDENEEDE